MPDIGYVAYIDEAGDFGLRTVAPIDERGASEWFVMGAAVIRKENEASLPGWLREIRYDARNTQPQDLHFRKLNDRQKRTTCERLAELPIRLFVVISNKRNMRRHKNEAASKVSTHRRWFYWWMTRLLLERVTDFCAAQNTKAGTPDRKVEIEFSRRKDLRRNEFTDYFTKLWLQGNSVVLDKRQIDWSVIDLSLANFYDHTSRAGLQVADVVASSFFQAVNIHPHGHCSPEYASLLRPRVCRGQSGSMLDEGFTVWPHSLVEAQLSESQKQIFRHFGFPEVRLTR